MEIEINKLMKSVDKYSHLSDAQIQSLQKMRDGGRLGAYCSYNQKKSKPVMKCDLEGNVIGEYISIMEASRQNGISHKTIRSALVHKSKTRKGFVWKYKTD